MVSLMSLWMPIVLAAVHGAGPFVFSYVNPSDDPSKPKK